SALASAPALTTPPFPYTTLFRSPRAGAARRAAAPGADRAHVASRPDRRPARRGAGPLARCAVGLRAAARARAAGRPPRRARRGRSEEHTSELQSLAYLVCRLLLE